MLLAELLLDRIEAFQMGSSEPRASFFTTSKTTPSRLSPQEILPGVCCDPLVNENSNIFTGVEILATNPVRLLLVDDDEIDVESVLRAFAANNITNPVTIARNGFEALEALRGIQGRERLRRPYVVLLDLNMPRMNGLEFLHQLRQDEELKSTVVFVLSTSKSDADMTAAYKAHVAGYFLKANVGQEMSNLPRMMKNYWRIVELPSDQQNQPI